MGNKYSRITSPSKTLTKDLILNNDVNIKNVKDIKSIKINQYAVLFYKEYYYFVSKNKDETFNCLDLDKCLIIKNGKLVSLDKCYYFLIKHEDHFLLKNPFYDATYNKLVLEDYGDNFISVPNKYQNRNIVIRKKDMVITHTDNIISNEMIESFKEENSQFSNLFENGKLKHVKIKVYKSKLRDKDETLLLYPIYQK
jgi:hypothetical protein